MRVLFQLWNHQMNLHRAQVVIRVSIKLMNVY